MSLQRNIATGYDFFNGLLGQSPSGTYEGEGFVILRHEDTEVVKRGIKRVIEQIYVELA